MCASPEHFTPTLQVMLTCSICPLGQVYYRVHRTSSIRPTEYTVSVLGRDDGYTVKYSLSTVRNFASIGNMFTFLVKVLRSVSETN